MADTPELDDLAIPGSPLGTPNYMAPERIFELPVDARTDVFSLGVVIYEMATKTRPFGGKSVVETVTNVLDADPAPLTRLSRGRPKMLERVVNKALAKRADDRYQSAAELLRALRAIDPHDGIGRPNICLVSARTAGPGRQIPIAVPH